MSTFLRFARTFALGFGLLLTGLAGAADKNLLAQDAEAALQSLYKHQPGAQALGEKSAGILVFPKIVRAGFVVGGSGGEGVLFKKGKVAAYYSSGSASVGLQAGIQSFGYAVFFVTSDELKKFERSKGWDVGSAPTLVLIDSGVGKEVNFLTSKDSVFAFVFGQEGLMAGIGLQGQKITRMK